MRSKAKLTDSQKRILEALRSGKILSATYGGFEIDLGEMRRFQAHSDPVPVRTRISMRTINNMAEKGIICRSTGVTPEGSRFLKYEPMTTSNPCAPVVSG